MIDPVCGRLHHAPCTTTGAKSPPFTTERHQVFMQTTSALHTKEAVLQQATPEVILELLAHETGQVTT